jgi:ribosomal protein L11 methylase PrmA
VDLLLYNLTADVIAQVVCRYPARPEAWGSVIFSGILVEQHAQIRDMVKRNAWTIEDDRTAEEWIALVVRKPYGH